MPIVATAETKVKNTCDCLWGINECPNPAAFLVKHKNSKAYSIMCEVHKTDFESVYPNAPVEIFDWSLELNRKFAEEAKE
jgi:hypothetical protein